MPNLALHRKTPASAQSLLSNTVGYIRPARSIVLLKSQVCAGAMAEQSTVNMRDKVPKEPLKKHKLGNSNLEVTYACIGTMMMGSTNTEEEARDQLDYYVKQGGNFIDTAEGYPVPVDPKLAGDSERMIGRWLKDRGCRDEMVIATKVCGRMPPTWVAASGAFQANRLDPPREDPGPICLDRQNILDACEGSLRRLQIDCIDLYQIHWPDRYTPKWGKHQFNPAEMYEHVPFDETAAAMGELVKAGKVRHWGLSNETAYGVTRMCEAALRVGAPLPISLQNDYSITDRAFDTETAEACAAYGVQLLSYGSLNGGFLSGKYLYGARPEGARHTKNKDFQHRYSSPAVEEALLKYKALADKKGLSLTQFCIAWVAQKWHIGAVITGQTKVSQLEEYLSAFEVELDEETLAEVERIHMENRNPNWAD